MREHLDSYAQWWDANQPFILVTITDVVGSAPLPVGDTMAIGVTPEWCRSHRVEDLDVVGSVSGGCVESDIMHRAHDMLISGILLTTARFGFSDDTAFAQGLTCGGQLGVILERVDARCFPDFAAVIDGLTAARTVTIGSRYADHDALNGPSPEPPLRVVVVDGNPSPHSQAPAHVLDIVRRAEQRSDVGCPALAVDNAAGGDHDDMQIFVRTYRPPPRMLIFGAIDFAAALSRVATTVGFDVTVCDARAAFATSRRFPDAHVVVDWPHRYLQNQLDANTLDDRTAICVLTHDLKFDIPLLDLAITSAPGYLGAMGSRRTHRERVGELLAKGHTPEDINKIHSPIGLDLGVRSAAGTAVSIVAEILAVSNGRSGGQLSLSDNPIHPTDQDTRRAPSRQQR